MAGVVENVCMMLMRQRNYVSESSSSSDDEWEAALRQRGKRKLRPRIKGYGDVVHSYMDHEFKSHFRMSKATFEYLLSIIGKDLTRKIKGCPTIASHQQLMIALWKMATMDSYRSICDRFNVGRATGLRSVRRVTNALFRQSARFIQWPTGDRVVQVMRGFEEGSGFPKTIGAIDGTHIRIDAPKENSADYVNRKGFHSIQLQRPLTATAALSGTRKRVLRSLRALSGTHPRKVSNSIAHWGPALALVGLCYVRSDNAILAVIALTTAVGLNAGSICGFQINHIDLSPKFAGTMMSITNCIAAAVAIIVPLVCASIVTDETNAAQWRIVFFLTAAIYFVGNLIFVIFGKAEIQWWNNFELTKVKEER